MTAEKRAWLWAWRISLVLGLIAGATQLNRGVNSVVMYCLSGWLGWTPVIWVLLMVGQWICQRVSVGRVALGIVGAVALVVLVVELGASLGFSPSAALVAPTAYPTPTTSAQTQPDMRGTQDALEAQDKEARSLYYQGYTMVYCSCDSGLYGCDDFELQREAQLCYERCLEKVGRDTHHLDDDNDRKACELLP